MNLRAEYSVEWWKDVDEDGKDVELDVSLQKEQLTKEFSDEAARLIEVSNKNLAIAIEMKKKEIPVKETEEYKKYKELHKKYKDIK